MKRNDLMRPAEIRYPREPKAINIAINKVAEEIDLRMARTLAERQRLFDDLKRSAAFELVEAIMKDCQFFEVSDLMSPNLKLQMEFTISDRGTFENWLPVAEQRAKREGRAQAAQEMVASLPFGLADAAHEFYD